jgi:K+-sensing histidine kinase KdpD
LEIDVAYTLNEWIAGKTAYLKDNGLQAVYQQHFYDLQAEIPDKMARSERVEEIMGLTYEVLQPYIDEHIRGKKRRQAKRTSKTPVQFDPEKHTSADDVRDIRWAMAHLSDEAVMSSDAPSPIAWNLLIASRQSQAGLLKLMEIFRQVVVPKQADAALANAVSTDDARLSDLLSRLTGDSDD